MGTNYTGEGSNGGIIPKVMESIFERVEATKDSTEFLIRASFIEVKKASNKSLPFLGGNNHFFFSFALSSLLCLCLYGDFLE